MNELRTARLYYRICAIVLLIVASAASFSAFYEKWHFRDLGCVVPIQAPSLIE